MEGHHFLLPWLDIVEIVSAEKISDTMCRATFRFTVERLLKFHCTNIDSNASIGPTRIPQPHGHAPRGSDVRFLRMCDDVGCVSDRREGEAEFLEVVRNMSHDQLHVPAAGGAGRGTVDGV